MRSWAIWFGWVFYVLTTVGVLAYTAHTEGWDNGDPVMLALLWPFAAAMKTGMVIAAWILAWSLP